MDAVVNTALHTSSAKSEKDTKDLIKKKTRERQKLKKDIQRWMKEYEGREGRQPTEEEVSWALTCIKPPLASNTDDNTRWNPYENCSSSASSSRRR